jgi:hypothetical protein
MAQIQHAITASFNDLDFVIQSFHKATGVSVDEVVGNLLLVSLKGPEELVKTGEVLSLNNLLPSP